MNNRWSTSCFCLIGMLFISIAAADEETSYPKLFYGQINNKLNIQMILTRQGSVLSGIYFYTAIGKDLYLKGTVDPKGNIRLDEFDDRGKQTGTFKGVLMKGKMSGIWSTPDELKLFPFSLATAESSQSDEVIAHRLHYYIDLIESAPTAAVQGLKALRTPTTNAYLAYLYYTGKVSVSQPQAEINRLLREAAKGIERQMDLENFPELKKEKFVYANLGEFLLDMRFIIEADYPTVPCWMFRAHKEAYEAFGPYWGGVRDSCLQLCKDYGSIEQMNGVKQFTEIVDAIERKDPKNAGGSIRHFFYRLWKIADMKASISPQLLLEENEENRALLDLHPQRVRFLEIWSNDGLWNKETYTAFVAALPRAMKVLKRHYTDHFDMDAKQAEKAATIAVASLTERIFTEEGGEDEATDLSLSQDIAYQTFTRPQLDVSQATRLVTSGRLKQDELDRGLKYAILNHLSLDIIRFLVEKGARSDVGDESALMMAVKRPEVIRYLLKSGANPNYQNSFGKTALCYAAQYDALESARLLVEKGAQVNHTLKTHEAIERKAIESDYAINPYSSDADEAQMTPLMFAARYASLPLIRFLVEKGAGVRAKDSQGRQAVDYLTQNTTLSKADQEQARRLLR